LVSLKKARGDAGTVLGPCMLSLGGVIGSRECLEHCDPSKLTSACLMVNLIYEHPFKIVYQNCRCDSDQISIPLSAKHSSRLRSESGIGQHFTIQGVGQH